ncbi:nitroreductase family deazaflavin-dependent oxidoreductase [Svornostia abyssi]|uniref:Nitroreductase family deazaflavin-dependent oxidoreductase n=1 Tax=Svornostia abyssi TaxID=2898438 RepID=A0ABY5PHN0_9ACTN|nr:nitroreductase family deazaflavin-dependent oxidoreductase [Parviterribacteraceae bacterium J379]
MLKAIRVFNPLVAAILRSRAHRLVSGALLLLTVTGRRSGRRFTFPVMYARDGADILVFVGMHAQKQWWRNLRGGADVVARVRGDEQIWHAELLEGDREALAGPLAAYLRRFPKAEGTVGDDVVMVRLSCGQ